MKPENKVTLATDGDVDRFGNVALIDPERLAELSAFNWRVKRQPHGNYVWAYDNTTLMEISIHHAVFGQVPVGFEVDHRNGNTMDNRRENLRQATRQQQSQNRQKLANRSSQFKGVTFNKKANKWQAQAKLDNKSIFLGLFDPTPIGEVAAARIYDDFARMWFGEFANPNFPNDSTTIPERRSP